MANRFNAKPKINYDQRPLSSGYSDNGQASDFVIPSVGLEDIDRAMFSLFDNELPLSVGGTDGSDLKKVPVIFAGGEKWAILKRNRAMRDKTNSLILPLIAIGRPNFAQTTADDITGRGINQHSGEIVIRRRLDKSDRSYQSVINRIFLKHQDGLAVASADADPGQLTTLRAIGELEADPVIEDGGSLVSDLTNNVFETLVIPSPQFVTANYEIIVWTQYTHHMNQIMETLVSSFLPQTRGWKLETTKGYWFVATVDDDIFNAETNFDDMSQGERMVKCKFSVKVPAYVLASSAPGVPVPVKRYVSSPRVEFNIGMSLEESMPDTVEDPFLGSDDPTLPLDNDGNRRRDQRQDGRSRLYTYAAVDPHDPALTRRLRGEQLGKYKRVVTKDLSGRLTSRLVRVATVNQYTGETSYAPGTDLGGFSIVVIEE